MFGYFGKSRAEKSGNDERMKALREGLLKPNENVRSSVEARKAISYCEYCILEYEELFELNEAKWLQWQTVVIVGGVVGTLAHQQNRRPRPNDDRALAHFPKTPR